MDDARDSGPQRPRQEPKILIEIRVIDEENLILARPDLIFVAFQHEQSCKWECIVGDALHAGTAYTFLLADDKVTLVGGLCPRCRAHPYLRQILIDLFSQAFPSINWKLPLISMPPGMQ